MTLDGLKQLITADEVKNALDAQIFDSLNYGRRGGDLNTNVQAAVFAAARWGYSRLMGASAQNKTFDADAQEVLRMALIKRAVYELGRTSEFKESFDMDRDDADTMMDALLGRGDGSSGGDTGNDSNGYVGAVSVQYGKQSCHTALFPTSPRRKL